MRLQESITFGFRSMNLNQPDINLKIGLMEKLDQFGPPAVMTFSTIAVGMVPVHLLAIRKQSANE
jgi:hypothetical protein